MAKIKVVLDVPDGAYCNKEHLYCDNIYDDTRITCGVFKERLKTSGLNIKKCAECLNAEIKE